MISNTANAAPHSNKTTIPSPEATTTAAAASAAHSAVDVAAENLAKAERALREAQTTTGVKVSDTAEKAQMYSEEAVSSIRGYVNENPLRSVGIALAAGYLLSSVMKK